MVETFQFLRHKTGTLLGAHIKNDTPPDRCPLEYHHSNKKRNLILFHKCMKPLL